MPEKFVRRSNTTNPHTMFIAFLVDKHTPDGFCCLYRDKAYFAWEKGRVRVDLSINPNSVMELVQSVDNPFETVDNTYYYFDTQPKGVFEMENQINKYLNENIKETESLEQV